MLKSLEALSQKTGSASFSAIISVVFGVTAVATATGGPGGGAGVVTPAAQAVRRPAQWSAADRRPGRRR